MDKTKVMLILMGIVVILLFLGDFSQYKSSLDLLYITMGMMVVIFGFFVEGEKFNETVTYFVAMSAVNIFQWLIVINILFISQVYLTIQFFIVLAIAPVMTIFLINRLRRSNLKYLGNQQRKNKDLVVADKMNVILTDKTKAIYIFVGIV
ncbi:hypothetical protein, partial [Methanobacterium sp. 42_16]|uniref:hypothetical protein n=1 Tax=Methanobacterium sp. 42_16 TaxID=1641383 RepID=UPI00257A1071